MKIVEHHDCRFDSHMVAINKGKRMVRRHQSMHQPLNNTININTIIIVEKRFLKQSFLNLPKSFSIIAKIFLCLVPSIVFLLRAAYMFYTVPPSWGGWWWVLHKIELSLFYLHSHSLICGSILLSSMCI